MGFSLHGPTFESFLVHSLPHERQYDLPSLPRPAGWRVIVSRQQKLSRLASLSRVPRAESCGYE